ncbi:MAG: alpha/beta hydrolase [Candidatus Thiodiazotropha sp.]
MLLLTVLLLVPLSLALLFPLVVHLVYRAPRVEERTTPQRYGLPFTQHWLPGVGNRRLYAWSIPKQESRATLVVVHGWGANAEMMLPLAPAFHAAEMDLLLYDARSHGRSDSDSFSSLPRFAEDLETVLDWVKQRHPDHRLVVFGHSIGAAAAILTASRRHDIDCVIGLSGFAHPRLVMNRHLDRPWLPRFLRPLIINYIQWVIGYRFDDIAPMNRIPHVRCPVLLAHGSDDNVVPISDMRLIEANATPGQPVRVLEIPGARHASLDRFKQQADRLIEFIHQAPASTPSRKARAGVDADTS